MQDNHLLASAQNKPSLAILEENIRVRLERFTFSSQSPLEHYHKSGHQLNENTTEAIVNHLEITILDLKYLINDLYWLQWIKDKRRIG